MKAISEAHVPAAGGRQSFEFYLEGVVELLLRPERFLKAYLNTRPFGFPLLAIWIVGMGGFIDRLDARMVRADGIGSGGSMVSDMLASSWPSFWLSVAVIGLFSGLFIWLIMGWWYQIRLQLSGAADPDPKEARLVLIHARLVASVPIIFTTLLQMPFHASYEAMSGSDSVALVWFTAPVWSIFVGYRGAIGCFDVDPKKARFWFLILPLVFLVGLIGVFYFA